MITSTADYAIRAVLVLAAEENGRPLRADWIADATGAPRNYMAKTLNALVKAGVLNSSRGPQGGFALSMPPSVLTLARVIDCFAEPRKHVRCLLGNRPCDPERPCAAHKAWAEITETRRDPLTKTTIADLIGRNN
ncbi:MAG TPA: Rrf2 family transcriptional regulator [Gemmatimonadaceae bacterium]